MITTIKLFNLSIISGIYLSYTCVWGEHKMIRKFPVLTTVTTPGAIGPVLPLPPLPPLPPPAKFLDSSPFTAFIAPPPQTAYLVLNSVKSLAQSRPWLS